MPEEPRALSARSATRTISAQFVARAVSVGAVVGSTALVARTVGIEVYADWATVLSLVALLAVVLDPGITPVIVRRLAQEPEAAPRPEALRRPRLIMGAAALAIVVLVTVVLRGTDALVLAAVLAGQVLPRALVLNATPWLQVDHRLHRQAFLEAATAGIGLCALAVGVAFEAPAEVLALAGFLAPTTLLALLVRRELVRTPAYGLPSPGPQGEKILAVAREIAPLAGALVLTTLYTRMNSIFVNLAEDAAGVARFLFAFQFVEQAIVAAGIVAAAILPLLAARARHSNLLTDRTTAELCIAMVAVGALGSAALLAAAGPLCRLIGGPNLAPAAEYLELLSPMAALIMLAFTLGYVHVTLSMSARYLWINAIALGAGIMLHASVTLTEGAPAAARIAWIVETIVVVLAFVPLWRGGTAGRRAALITAPIFAVAVAGAELRAANLLPAPAAGALVAATAVVFAAGPLRRIVGPALRRPA